MQVVIMPGGELRCVHDEAIVLKTLGWLNIARGSHVEPDDMGYWFADLSPIEGPKIGPFTCRSLALEVEREWPERNWLQTSNDLSVAIIL
jgi:hypothetical protein